jgi:carbamoyl-phosphate synthase large subunit
MCLFLPAHRVEKIELLNSAKMMRDRGYNIFATEGTHRFFTENGVENTSLYWPDEENQRQIQSILSKKRKLTW